MEKTTTWNYPNGTGENTWSALTIPELREILGDPNISGEEINTTLSNLDKEAEEKWWNKSLNITETYRALLAKDPEEAKRFLQYKRIDRECHLKKRESIKIEQENHLKENRKKRPLYDKDGNPVEVSDEKVKFLDMASNIEKHCIQKWIDTIYFVGEVAYEKPDDGSYGIYWYYNNLFDTAWFCQKEDGTMYYVDNCATSVQNAKMEYYEDAKRFRKNMFPNMNVEFLEWELHAEEVRHGIKHRIECNFPKSRWALLMVEVRGAENNTLFEKFKSFNWVCIGYKWSWEFIEWKWIENFS